MKKSDLQKDQWKHLTGYDKVLQRIDGQGSTYELKAYSSSMMTALNIGKDTKNHSVGQKSPPLEQAWNIVLYGPCDEANNVKSQTSLSTLTQDKNQHPLNHTAFEEKLKELEKTSKQENKDTKNELMNEIRKMTETSAETTKDLKSIINTNDDAMTDLLKYNKAQGA